MDSNNLGQDLTFILISLYQKMDSSVTIYTIFMNIQYLFIIVTSVYSYYFMNKVLKSTPKDCELTKSEKTQVILLLLLNTLISWAIFSVGWKNKLPTKSAQVNKYVKIMILTLVGVAIAGFVLSILLVALNPAGQIGR